MPILLVTNKSQDQVLCSVTNYSNSRDRSEWCPIESCSGKPLDRKTWEVVAFQSPKDKAVQGGVYLDFSKGFNIEFYGFDDIRVSRTLLSNQCVISSLLMIVLVDGAKFHHYGPQQIK